MSKKTILDQFEIKNKLESLKIFMNRFNIEKRYLFFDDNVNHILEPKSMVFCLFNYLGIFNKRIYANCQKK